MRAMNVLTQIITNEIEFSHQAFGHRTHTSFIGRIARQLDLSLKSFNRTPRSCLLRKIPVRSISVKERLHRPINIEKDNDEVLLVRFTPI